MINRQTKFSVAAPVCPRLQQQPALRILQSFDAHCLKGSSYLGADTVQTVKICETGIFAKDHPPELFFFAIFFGFATKNFEWRARN